MIRSIRKILRSLLGSQIVDDETILTLMEDPPPPPPPTSDSSDAEPLTPSKLLLLRPNLCFPPGESDAFNIYGNKRWKQAQYLADIFWKRWIIEYLPTLQVKQKWLRPRPNLAVGDLVLVVNENSSRGHWPKGIVFLDRHGTVRQVTVKTATSVLRRDIRKLCLLEGVSGLKA